ncbi:hypothetical protein P4S72_11450 [Vibrio sp. PP-XX7]
MRHINGSYRPWQKLSEQVRLAAGLDDKNMLSLEAMQRGWDCLHLFLNDCRISRKKTSVSSGPQR